MGRIQDAVDSVDPTRSQYYGYDPLDRLTGAQQGQPAIAEVGYAYDLSGNRTGKLVNGQSTAYTTQATSNRLMAVSGAETRTFAYDAAGNLTGDGTNTYTYDDAGRRVSATVNGQSWQYAYNALGQRVMKRSGTVTTLFMYDEQGHLLGEYDGTGRLIQETVWLGDIPVATLKPSASGQGTDIYYVHADHLNTPRRISRPADNMLLWAWDSEPFGNSAPDQNPQGAGTFAYHLRFPGQYFDQETGLHYNYYRDYDPGTGRYVESDPIGLEGGINTYTYAGGNPISRTDAKGLDYWVEGALPNEGGLGFHQKLCVGSRRGSRYCISFGRDDRADCYQSCKGRVYDNSEGGMGPLTPWYATSDGATDSAIAGILSSLVGSVGTYSLFGNNCRDFSQTLFQLLVTH